MSFDAYTPHSEKDTFDLPPTSPRKLTWRDCIERFTPAWFYIPMGLATGALSLGAQPYHHDWLLLKVLCMIWFFAALITFFIGVIGLSARFIMFPHLWKRFVRHPMEPLYLGCIPMAMVPLTNLINEDVTTYLGFLGESGYKMQYFAFAIYCTSSFIAYFLMFWLLSRMITKQNEYNLQTINAGWMLPFLPCIVAASSGAILIKEILPLNRSMAFFILAWATFQLSIGLFMCCIVISLLFMRLMIVRSDVTSANQSSNFSLRVPTVQERISPMGGFPASNFAMTNWLPLSSITQAGFTIMILGAGAGGIFPAAVESASPLVQDKLFGPILASAAFMIGFAMWGIAAFWLAYALMSFVHASRKGHLHFRPDSWAWVFPYGVFALHTYGIGQELDSRVFFYIYFCLMSLLVVGSFLMSVFTVWKIARGGFFHSYIVDWIPTEPIGDKTVASSQVTHTVVLPVHV